jgi:hypothetical protein
MSEDSSSSAARHIATPTDGEAELRAAVDHLQAAVSQDHDTLERLRAGLAGLAFAVARAKAAPIEPEDAAGGKLDVAALLGDFEARLAGLRALLDMPAPDQPAPDQSAPSEVPTVSHVVSQLGRGEDSAAPSPADATVSALGAMVEKLAASMFPRPPPAEPAPVLDAPPSTAAPPRAPLLPENDLMSSFARMESVPHLPVEVGTAVIFDRPAGPEPAAAAAPEVAPQDGSARDAAATPTAMALAAPVAESAAAPEPAAEPVDLDPAGILGQPPSVPVRTEAGAETDNDPAGFLLEPVPAPPAPQPQPKIPHDPLAPVKALSDVEKIALFS